MSRTGIVIVTHNSSEWIEECLSAACRQQADVVVVDNASEDDTCRRVRLCPAAKLIPNSSNRGFAAAVNQGIGALDNELVLLLNPDAILLAGLESLAAACRAPGVAAAGGRLVDEQGGAQTGFVVRRFPTPAALALEVLGINRLWPSNRVNRRYRHLDLDLSRASDVEQPAGAFLMIRRQAWRELDGFDEAFRPLWFEEVDFLKRARDRGWRIRYEPAAAARHRGAHSADRMSPQARAVCWYGNLLRYSARHFEGAAFRCLCLAVAVGALARMAAGMLGQGSAGPAAVYGRVIRLAGRCFLSGRVVEADGASAVTRSMKAVHR